MREVLNFVTMADHAFAWVEAGRPLSVAMLRDLQRILVRGTPTEGSSSGHIRENQVVIGRRKTAGLGELPIKAARFVPPPPGDDLNARVQDLIGWMVRDHANVVDPVVAAAIGHYQFETLHPFHDGNGRIGRLLIVLQDCFTIGTLSEPTLTVSPWFEARRPSTTIACSRSHQNRDGWVSFFSQGLEESAIVTRQQMLDLVAAQGRLKEIVRSSNLRADTAHALVDYAVANVSFTVRHVERDLGVSYGRANRLVADLVRLDVLHETGSSYRRRFFAPRGASGAAIG